MPPPTTRPPRGGVILSPFAADARAEHGGPTVPGHARVPKYAATSATRAASQYFNMFGS